MASIIDEIRNMFVNDIEIINDDCQGDYLTVKEFLGLASMSEARVIAGENGLDNKCTSIVAWETPEGLDWVVGGEFILTTGYAFKDHIDVRETYIDKIKKHGCSGIAIKINRYIDDVPQNIIDRANELRVPLVILPSDTFYTVVVSSFYEALFYKSNAYLLELKKTHEQLLNLVFDYKDINGVIKDLGELCDASIVLVGPDHLIQLSYLKHHIEKPLQRESELELAFSNPSFFCYSVPIKYSNQLSGKLFAYALKEFNYLSKHTLNHGSKIIGLKLKQDTVEIFNEIRIKKMITGLIIQEKNLPEDFLLNVIKNVGWDNKALSYGIGLKLYIEGHSNFDVEKLQTDIYTLLKTTYRDTIYLLNETNGIVLIYFNRITQEKLNDFIESLKFRYLTNKSNVRLSVNLSRAFHDLLQLSQVQDECIVTALINKPGEILSFESLGTIKLLTTLKNDPRVVQQYNDIMSRIEDYDKQNEGVLIDTLITYFENNMNKKETSEALHIHVETLRYRLNKVEALTDCSTSSSEGLFILQLMIKLRYIID